MTTEITIPTILLDAARTVSGYMDAHRYYRDRYDVNDVRAWRMLEEDLEKYGLPGRYSSEGSFWKNRLRYTRCLLRKATPYPR